MPKSNNNKRHSVFPTSNILPQLGQKTTASFTHMATKESLKVLKQTIKSALDANDWPTFDTGFSQLKQMAADKLPEAQNLQRRIFNEITQKSPENLLSSTHMAGTQGHAHLNITKQEFDNYQLRHQQDFSGPRSRL